MSGALLLSACGSTSSVPAAAPVAALADLVTGTAESSQALRGTGDWAAPKGGTPTGEAATVSQKWVQLTAARAGDLDPVLVNGAGLTLYRFDQDTAKPSKSTCNGDCAAKWPPVTVKPGGRIFLAGVQKSKVGVVKRDDGRLQVTVGGWPVYRFAKDTAPGDTKGQGVGGTWFGVRPDGKKAGVDEAGETPPPGDGGGRNVPAKRVVLFSARSFNVFDKHAQSQLIEGKRGCVDATAPGTASSIVFDGLVKIWSGPGCTGQSKELGALDAENVGGIADLREIGFDNRIGSVKL
ncbi:hypothetical protein [Couchioplanes azureus]|uniref:hypothetical protein n=1 Tax=Couchioplanes caeruleus TaxID=56438 RepID=UPI001E489ACB|nr:hypothetical protein [Couchioplanes caeruleus]